VAAAVGQVPLTFQPALGSADAPQDVYVVRGADLVGEPEIDEAEAVRWVPVKEALEMIRTGEIIGAATVIGVLHAVAERMRRNSPHKAVQEAAKFCNTNLAAVVGFI
jgi:hypothetical protein